MVQFDEARQLMDEMMKVTIFQPSEKRRMLEDERRTFLDPNLVMDTRHRIFRENQCKSSANSSILAEARRLLTQEEMRELQSKREQTFIKKELRKFEQDLRKSRPKFCESYTCSRKNIASSDDEEFWRISNRIKQPVNKRRSKTAEQKFAFVQKRVNKEVITEVSTAESEDIKRCSINKIEDASFGNIKVTIKDKSNCESEEQRSCILRSYFEILRENAWDKRRLREIKINIQNIASRGTMRRCIRAWRAHVRKDRYERHVSIADAKDFDVSKIETFVNAITETQKELSKCRKAESKDFFSSRARDSEVRKTISSIRPLIVESPTQNRLNAQKEIIRKQKMKLAEQSKLIDELKLKQVQKEITRAGEQTVNAAKETLTHCGQQTRRTLIQLMRQAGYRDKSLTAPLRVPSPPKFLTRMEARAEARRNRIKLRKETRQKKLENERKEVEAIRREEERENKRLQQEALCEMKRMRQEWEQQRAREIERCKKLHIMAETFYRKLLLRRYIMEPFIALVEMKNLHVTKARDHYERCLLRRTFASWKTETKYQIQIKTELAISLYNRNLSWYTLQKWKKEVKEKRKKEQVAKDFSDMKLQDKYFKLWKIKTVEYKTERIKKERLALEHYEERLKIKYFNIWKKYLQIVPNIIESERIKNIWREIVQEVVPDFDPRQRGVILDD